MEFVYITAAILAAGFGFSQLDDGSRGIGLICLACFMAIIVRLLQADTYQKAMLEAIRDGKR